MNKFVDLCKKYIITLTFLTRNVIINVYKVLFTKSYQLKGEIK